MSTKLLEDLGKALTPSDKRKVLTLAMEIYTASHEYKNEPFMNYIRFVYEQSYKRLAAVETAIDVILHKDPNRPHNKEWVNDVMELKTLISEWSELREEL